VFFGQKSQSLLVEGQDNSNIFPHNFIFDLNFKSLQNLKPRQGYKNAPRVYFFLLFNRKFIYVTYLHHLKVRKEPIEMEDGSYPHLHKIGISGLPLANELTYYMKIFILLLADGQYFCGALINVQTI
jgi:hypothetical protein